VLLCSLSLGVPGDKGGGGGCSGCRECAGGCRPASCNDTNDEDEEVREREGVPVLEMTARLRRGVRGGGGGAIDPAGG